jgi:uncharacterized membrane protein
VDVWLNDTYELFVSFLDRTTPGESGAVAGFCIFLGALALSSTGTALGAIKAFYKTCVVLTVAGVFLLVAALAAPEAFGYDDTVWLPMAAAGCVLLVVVVPLTMWVLRGRYIPVLIAWIVTLLTVGAVLTLEPLMMEKFKNWDRSIQSEKHRIEMERYNYGTGSGH